VSAIAKTLQSVNLNPRSLGISLVVVMGVVALFLIPEMVGFQTSVSKNAPVAASAPAAEMTSEEAVLPESEVVVPMEDSQPIENEYAALEGVDRSIEAPADDHPSATLETGEQLARDEASKQLEKPQLTWGDLRSKQTTVIFEKARIDVSYLLQSMKTQFGKRKTTEYALLNFYNGLGMILQHNAPFMSPDEAIAYLEVLDSNVTKAMIKDDVDRAIYSNWVRVSLGSLLSGTSASRLKERYQVPFNPELMLGNISISQGINKPGYPYASYYNSFRLYGYLKGQGVKKLSVFHNKEFKQDLNLTAQDQRGLKQFFFPGTPATGVWTFRAYDEFGATYEKSYSFLPRAGSFRQDDAGIFIIPFLLPFAGYEGPNKPLDRFFLLREKVHQDGGGGLGSFSESSGWTAF
jgi:hypothetical protein